MQSESESESNAKIWTFLLKLFECISLGEGGLIEIETSVGQSNVLYLRKCITCDPFKMYVIGVEGSLVLVIIEEPHMRGWWPPEISTNIYNVDFF